MFFGITQCPLKLLIINIISQEYILFTKGVIISLDINGMFTNNSLHESGVKLRKNISGNVMQ